MDPSARSTASTFLDPVGALPPPPPQAVTSRLVAAAPRRGVLAAVEDFFVAQGECADAATTVCIFSRYHTSLFRTPPPHCSPAKAKEKMDEVQAANQAPEHPRASTSCPPPQQALRVEGALQGHWNVLSEKDRSDLVNNSVDLEQT